MTYEEWQERVPSAIRDDTLWRVEAYRIALFLSDLAWRDASKLARDQRTREIADQLFRATGKISAQIAEGYSRNSGRERARYYEYALGSAREARDWYYKARFVLTEAVSSHRIERATALVRLMLTMASHERRTDRKIVRAE